MVPASPPGSIIGLGNRPVRRATGKSSVSHREIVQPSPRPRLVLTRSSRSTPPFPRLLLAGAGSLRYKEPMHRHVDDQLRESLSAAIDGERLDDVASILEFALWGLLFEDLRLATRALATLAPHDGIWAVRVAAARVVLRSHQGTDLLGVPELAPGAPVQVDAVSAESMLVALSENRVRSRPHDGAALLAEATRRDEDGSLEAPGSPPLLRALLRVQRPPRVWPTRAVLSTAASSPSPRPYTRFAATWWRLVGNSGASTASGATSRQHGAGRCETSGPSPSRSSPWSASTVTTPTPNGPRWRPRMISGRSRPFCARDRRCWNRARCAR